jgi:exodeoxyribonuclease VIII
MPEIRRGVSYDDYVRMPGVRVSDLVAFKRTALHARHAMLNPRSDTPSTLLGTALHAAVLEPKEFLANYTVAPDIDKRTKEGKAAWSAFEAAHAGLHIVLRQDEMDLVLGMTRAVTSHAVIEPLLGLPSMREAVVLWQEGSTPCKARIDWIVAASETLVIDLKSTRDAGQDAFAKAIASYSYHAQAASYLRALAAASPTRRSRRFLWVVVENQAPHGVAVYEPSEGLLAQGDADYGSWLRQYTESSERQHWPGYPDMITAIDLPRWAWRTEERE